MTGYPIPTTLPTIPPLPPLHEAAPWPGWRGVRSDPQDAGHERERDDQ